MTTSEGWADGLRELAHRRDLVLMQGGPEAVARQHANGKLTATALARKLSLPIFRLRGLLAIVRRVLNIDGFSVLGQDEQSETIEFDRNLLLRQFDLLAENQT